MNFSTFKPYTPRIASRWEGERHYPFPIFCSTNECFQDVLCANYREFYVSIVGRVNGKKFHSRISDPSNLQLPVLIPADENAWYFFQRCRDLLKKKYPDAVGTLFYVWFIFQADECPAKESYRFARLDFWYEKFSERRCDD